MSAVARSGARSARSPIAASRARNSREGDDALRHLADFLDAFMWQAEPSTLRLTFVTDGVETLLGLPASHWLGEPDPWSRMVDEEDHAGVIECLRATAADGRDREVEFRARTAAGRTVSLHHAVRLLADETGNSELWGLTTDVTSDRRAEDALRTTKEQYRELSVQAAEFQRQALHDALTGLPNRVLLDDRLRAALEAARRARAECAVLLMDLDRFKEINDTQGHHAGDRVLRNAALRFRIALRAQDTAARIGGDEFAAVLPNTDRAGAIRAAERILAALGSRKIGASIGISLFPEHAAHAQELLGRADAAMYVAKNAGGGYAVFTPGAEATPKARLRRRLELRSALALIALLGIGSSAMNPVARLRSLNEDAADRLAAAVIELNHASMNEVGDAVGMVEQTIADISWKEVGEPQIVATLDRLENVLDGLEPDVGSPLGNRVEVLSATIDKARLAATLAGPTIAPDSVEPPPGGGVEGLPSPEEPQPTPSLP